MRVKDQLHIPGAYSLVGVKELPISGASHPLRREAPRWISWGSGTALVFGLGLFLLWQWWMHREPEDTGPRQIRVVQYRELGVPPSIARPTTPQMNVAQEVAIAAPPSIAVPEPVPDELASRTTIATQQEIADQLAPITMDDLTAGSGDSIVVQGGITRQEAAAAAKEFESVDQLPVRLSVDPPVYPPMARQALVEGTVMLEVKVGKDGKVRDVKVVSGPDMLRAAAIASAKSALFRPALFNGRPVEVWVAFPLTFRLRAGR